MQISGLFAAAGAAAAGKSRGQRQMFSVLNLPFTIAPIEFVA